MADDGVKLSSKTEKTFAELIALGGVKVPVLKKDVNFYQLPIEEIAIVDSICETQEEFLAAITSGTVHTILWKGNTTLIDFVATAGTFKLIFCQHYSLLGKNSTLVSPAGKNITIYGDIDCAAPATGGFSWILNCTSTSSIKCKWIHNSGVTGKIICDTGTVLYERLESGLTLETNGTPGSESYINQEFWDNTNGSTNSFLSQLRGEWEVGIVYLLNDFCTYGGKIYICLEGYTSDPESHNPSVDAAHWSLFIPSSTTSQTFTNDTTTVSAWNSSTHVLTPVAGVFYVGTALTAMTLAIPSTAAADEFHIKFTIATGSTLTNFVLSAVTSWIGGAPDLAAGATYEVSIQDGVGVIGLVEAV
jgi:hypothetical protein